MWSAVGTWPDDLMKMFRFEILSGGVGGRIRPIEKAVRGLHKRCWMRVIRANQYWFRWNYLCIKCLGSLVHAAMNQRNKTCCISLSTLIGDSDWAIKIVPGCWICVTVRPETGATTYTRWLILQPYCQDQLVRNRNRLGVLLFLYHSENDMIPC